MTTATHETTASPSVVPEVLTVEEVAVILRRSKSALYLDIAAGTFPIRTIKLGGRIRIPRVALDKFLAGE